MGEKVCNKCKISQPIENFNKQLRKILRKISIRNNNLNWIDYLQICIDNKNAQYNKTTKHTPNQLWHRASFYNNVKNNVVAIPNNKGEVTL